MDGAIDYSLSGLWWRLYGGGESACAYVVDARVCAGYSVHVTVLFPHCLQRTWRLYILQPLECAAPIVKALVSF